MGHRALLLQLSSFIAAILCSCAMPSGVFTSDCGQHFASIYQQTDDVNHIPLDTQPYQTWAFEETYDYFGNQTNQSPLPLIREQFTADLEGEINKQINKEMFAHYSFLSMAFHFYRDDINLPGFHKYFKIAADERMTHAHMLMEHLLKRGGRIRLNPIMIPCRHHWGRGLTAMEDALALQKEMLHSLRRLYALADEKNDPQTMDFIGSNFLSVQTDRVKQLSDYVMTLRRFDHEALGEYQFDKMTLSSGGEH